MADSHSLLGERTAGYWARIFENVSTIKFNLINKNMESNNNVPMVAAQHGIDFANPAALEALQRSCRYFVESDLVPTIYSAAKVGEKKAIANTIIALDMASRQKGASPFAVMQNLNIIQGRPSFSSAYTIATINSCGRYETLKYNVGKYEGGVWKDGKQVKDKFGRPLENLWCYAYTWERGQKWLSPEDKKENRLTSTIITMQMAVDEGWYSKAGSKWQTMPSQMLKYRAASFWQRAFAPELLMGMHTTEEVMDGMVDDVEYEDITEDSAEAKDEPKDDSLAARAAKITNANNKAAEKAAAKKAIEDAAAGFANAPSEVPQPERRDAPTTTAADNNAAEAELFPES